jgi:hypothetical protein
VVTFIDIPKEKRNLEKGEGGRNQPWLWRPLGSGKVFFNNRKRKGVPPYLFLSCYPKMES